MIRFALLAALAFPESTALKIVGPEKVDPYKMVRLSIDGPIADRAVIWDVTPEEAVDAEEMPGGRIRFVAPPGVYKVKARVISFADGKTSVESLRYSVVIGDPTKPLPPGPNPKTKADPVQATGRLSVGNSGCTATVISPRRRDGKWDVLTASHCTGGPGTRGTLRLKDGRALEMVVTARDARSDITWFETVRDDADDLPFADLAATDPEPGVKVFHIGYGIDKPGNREEGVVAGSRNSRGQLQFSLSVSSGDSGGSIFRVDNGEVVAAVCCTSSLSGYGSMWGGSAVSARSLRPVEPMIRNAD